MKACITHARRNVAGLSQSASWLIISLIAVIATGVASGAENEAEKPMLTASQLKRMSVEQLLQQEVVSVSRRPEIWRGAASNVFLIRGEGRAGTMNLPQALRLAPNLFVAQATSSLWGVNARGFVHGNSFSNKLLVLIDGRSVYSPLFSNVFWDATDFFMPDLATIEVISGPAGSNWGSNAVNGVINIKGKTAHETLGGLAYAAIGTADSDVGVRYGVSFGETGALRVYAKHRWFGDSGPNPGGPAEFDAGDLTQAGFRADWGRSETGMFTFQGDAFRTIFDTGPLPSDTRNDGANALFRWSRSLSADSEVWLRLFYDYTKRNVAANITEISRAADVEFQHRTQFANGQLFMWGANYRHLSDDIADTVGFAILPQSLEFGLGGAFAQHELSFADNAARLITGMRIEHNHFSGWEYQPTVRLAWTKPRRTMWLAASRATRIPSRLESGFFAPANPPFAIAGGPNIRAETVLAYEAGIRAQPIEGLSLTATAYLHEYDHLRTVEATTPIVQANGAEGRSFGLEVFADYDVTKYWRFRAGGTVNEQDTWLKPGGADIERGLGEASYPNLQAHLRSTFYLNRDVTLWLALRHVSKVPILAGGALFDVPAYTELDARLTWDFRPNIEISIVGRNLLNRSHPEIGHNVNTTLREIERQVQATIQWQF